MSISRPSTATSSEAQPGPAPMLVARTGRFYAEANIPIFSPTFSFPLFYALDLTAAVRYEEFRNNSTNVAVPKFGIRVAAVRRDLHNSFDDWQGLPRAFAD